MQMKALQKQADEINWPKSSNDLPVLTWDDFTEACKTRQLVVISGFIHDVSTFIDEHPGGRAFIKTRLGKDATTAFFGGVYDHSNGANNLLAQYRVGIISGGYEIESLKKYSQLIEDLKVSGAEGVAGKSGDISTKTRKTVVMKGDPQLLHASLGTPTRIPKLDTPRMTGGLGHAIEA